MLIEPVLEDIKPYNPMLPPEVWRNIILHATDTFPHPLSAHDFTEPTTIEAQRLICLELARRLHRLSLERKLKLSLVCWAWHDICVPLVYRSIRLTSSPMIEKLAQLFEADEKAGRFGSQQRSWWVRELWLDANICTCSMHDSAGSLNALLERLPRVESIRKFGKLNWSFDEAEEGKQVLERVILPPSADGRIRGPSHLDWTVTSIWNFQHFLSAHPNLNDTLPSIKSLELRPFFVFCTEPPETKDSILQHVPHFPALVSLRLFGSSACLQAKHFRMPQLKSLCVSFTPFDSLYNGGNSDVLLLDLLRTHGENLEELELDVSFHQPLSRMVDLMDMCPNLRRLHLPATILVCGKRLPPIRHTGVTTVGLTDMHKLVPTGRHGRFAKQLQSFLDEDGLGGAVEVVQDLSIKSHQQRQRCVDTKFRTAQDAIDYRLFWLGLVDSLERAGVALVDWKGSNVAGFDHNHRSMDVPCSEAEEVSKGLLCCH